MMKKALWIGASLLAVAQASSALAQAPAAPAPVPATTDRSLDDIVVTAQRQSERLQDVPISVSALSAKALDQQQIHNALDLQASLPNVTFTKTNFTSSSFTIRGIGDLCVGVSCDAATGIHINDVPVPATRLFETEYLDLERVEVLRGPQGTLYGRNATSGAVNFITAKPDLSGFHASGSGEVGNYKSYKVQGMINVPVSETLGARFAGSYLKRGGFTRNLFDNSRIDGRDLYQVRGSIRWQPGADTLVDLTASYFREDDNRSRIQKQLCHRDPTGVLGCLPDRLDFETVNANATFGGVLSSREFLGVTNPALTPFGTHSLYGPDGFSQFVQPQGLRTIASNVNPTYQSSEINAQARLKQTLGSIDLTVIAAYNRSTISSTTGYFANVPDTITGNAGFAAFRAAAQAPGSPFANGARAVFDAAGNLCSSVADLGYAGVFAGRSQGCFDRPVNYDLSRQTAEGYSVEGHIDSHFDGAFNFLLGGITLHSVTRGDYFVLQSEGNYVSALLGAGPSGGAAYLGPAYFNSEVDRYTLNAYGLFGEGYLKIAPTLKATLGLRYSSDRKFERDRTALLNFAVPYGLADAFASPFAATADFDAGVPGNQAYREAKVSFGRLTGRFVLDWKPSPDTLVYASYSRGYKSGGVNPPFNPTLFSAPTTFRPETINAFEVGTKATLAGGKLRINASAFYYDYKDLQLSRIISRTSFNDNADAEIYGAEIEAVVRPDPSWLFNFSASYLHSRIKNFQLIDTRDPSGGRSDTVIIKDITTAANCVVRPTAPGNAQGSNLLVAAVNGALGLRAPTPITGTTTTGAYSICAALANAIQSPSAPLRALFSAPTGSLPFYFNSNSAGVATGLPDGVPVDLSGKQLPSAPTFKFSAGAQYTLELNGDVTLVGRGDLTYTGEYYSRGFNRPIDRIAGYEIVNLSMQLTGPDAKWFVRGFVQNLTANDAITGQFTSDPASGLATNVFTLEPRRYGVAAGFNF
jgi:iron complex outermembrane recepter protein